MTKLIWQKFITAQSKILEHKSKPIGIDTSKEIQLEGLKLNLSVDQEIFKKVFKKEVEKVFKIKDFEFNQNYILTDLGVTETEEFKSGIIGLKELSEICYIDFNENPVIDGVITAKNDDTKERLKEIVGLLPTDYLFVNSGLIFMTIEEWHKANKIQGLIFNKKCGAVFSVRPSISYLISTFYKNLDISQSGSGLIVGGELHPEILDLFGNHFGLTKKANSLIFKYKNNEYIKERVNELENAGITFPEPENYRLTFYYDNTFYERTGSDLNCEVYRLKRSLKEYFPDDEFEFSYETHYKFNIEILDKGINALNINEEIFWRRLYSEIHGDIFNISMAHRTISFDFENEESLKEKIQFLKSFTYFDISYRGESHKYKFYVKFQTGLHELRDSLKMVIPNLVTKLIANGEKLIFRQFYLTGNKIETLSRLINQLDDSFKDSGSFSYKINDTFKEKYLCEENFELKVEQEEEKLSKLIRGEFFVCDRQENHIFKIGTLTKVYYPNLTFSIEAQDIEVVNEQIQLDKTIFRLLKPDLKGEKDKIKRLEDTVLKLADEKTKLPNDNAKIFLYDSSKAKNIKNIDDLLNKTSAEWQDFEKGIFPSNQGKLNESQKQAVFKSLYAEELALIQGPPGTGKSTAIAEIIWQHIRKAQNDNKKTKILLTSETNLAVDNAIDRLKNKQNNIVKPIRFGNIENLESEGFFYSLEAISSWEKSNASQSNTVSHWLNNIVSRVINQDDEQIDNALDKWKILLQNPNRETRELFADKYIEYVNLIGATGSSIGKLNSENKWTSFFRSYLNVFNKRSYENNDFRTCSRTDINFDTVIMDEASKATPPELALPVLYGKKSIIVGDHRQLPPMIDGEEIKDLLVSIGEKALAKTLSQKEFETSQFERLFLNIDESIKGTFDTQYRMHPAINEVIAQFYKEDSEKGLQCGLPFDETYHNSFDNWDSRYHGLKFKDIITPQTHSIWINVTMPEIQEGTSRVNFGEIDAINNILTVLKNSEGKTEFDHWLENQTQEEKQIGLISFYGKQLNYLEKMLVQNHSDLYKGKGKINDRENLIRLSTVDRFQGMERNIIIVSMVRSNKLASYQGQQADYNLYPVFGYPTQESLGFAESPNRLNVALSRARRLLIVVGNSEHFCRKDIYKNVYDKMQKIISSEELQKAVEEYGKH